MAAAAAAAAAGAARKKCNFDLRNRSVEESSRTGARRTPIDKQ